jgi:hypothetical protein
VIFAEKLLFSQKLSLNLETFLLQLAGCHVKWSILSFHRASAETSKEKKKEQKYEKKSLMTVRSFKLLSHKYSTCAPLHIAMARMRLGIYFLVENQH